MLKIKILFDSGYSYTKTLKLLEGKCVVIKRYNKKHIVIIGVEDEEHLEQLYTLIAAKISKEKFYTILYKKYIKRIPLLYRLKFPQK